MKFEVDEIAVIVAECPEFTIVDEDLLQADDGYVQTSITKNDLGYYEVVTTNFAEEDDPGCLFDISNFREVETMEQLLRYLKGAR